MIYSKWDSSANVYHYYETHDIGPRTLQAPLTSINGLGVPADHAGHDLPINAKYVGFGTQAKGVLAKVIQRKKFLGIF